jgi:anti-sigma regulatory factor (Ser/Thr protein kinase)
LFAEHQLPIPTKARTRTWISADPIRVPELPVNRSDGRSASAHFKPEPRSVTAARRFVRDTLGDVADTTEIELMVSEVAANAVLHANCDFEVDVSMNDGIVRVEVINDAPQMVASMRQPTDQTGRGLHILDGLATRWGTESRRTDKVVWFEARIA